MAERYCGKCWRRTGQHIHDSPAQGLPGMSRILIVEDEAHIADGLRFNLEAEGHSVEVTATGEDALQRLQKDSHQFEILVLDVMLPGKDGFTVARELRQSRNYIPLLMLTARGRPEDVLKGFEAGADDYLPKPFDLDILIARIGSLLRRKDWLRDAGPANQDTVTAKSPDSPEIFKFNGKVVDFQKLQVRTSNQIFQLTVMDLELLCYLIQKLCRPVSRNPFHNTVMK